MSKQKKTKLPKDPRDHYIATDISLRKLAELYSHQKGCSLRQLGDRSRKENWPQLREQNRNKTATKFVEKIAEKSATETVDRITQVNNEDDELATFFMQLVRGKANDYIETDPETGKKKVSATEQQLQKLFSAARTAQQMRREALGMTSKTLDMKSLVPVDGTSEDDILEKLNEVAEEVWGDVEDGG